MRLVQERGFTVKIQKVSFFNKKNGQKKELMKLSDLFVSAGSRTLFDLVLWKFLQFSLRSVIV